MKVFDFEDIESYPVVKDERVPKQNDEGKKVVAWKTEDRIFVHPDHWDEFMDKLKEIASSIDDDE